MLYHHHGDADDDYDFREGQMDKAFLGSGGWVTIWNSKIIVKTTKEENCRNIEQKLCSRGGHTCQTAGCRRDCAGAINNTISGPGVVKNFSFDKICTPE